MIHQEILTIGSRTCGSPLCVMKLRLVVWLLEIVTTGVEPAPRRSLGNAQARKRNEPKSQK